MAVEPSGPGIRLDSGVYQGFTVPLDYDPLLAKLAVWAATREDAIERMTRALGEYHIAGIVANLAFFRRLCERESGAYWTFIVHTGTRTFIGATPERHVSLRAGTAVSVAAR